MQRANLRMAKLQPQSSAAHRRPTATIVMRGKHGSIKALGHADEVAELKRGGQKLAAGVGPAVQCAHACTHSFVSIP